MAPSVSISILVVALVLCNFMHDTTMVIAAGSVAAYESSSALEQQIGRHYETVGGGLTIPILFWPGITCNVRGSVTGIDMATVYVRYKSYYEISKFNFSSFPNLVGLNLSCIAFGTLSKLTYLNLSQNLLTGELPISLTNLTQLWFHPRELVNSKNLIAFSLSNNKFIGAIPSALGLLNNLSSLNMSSNEINGFIASEIGLLKNLLT
ncbi:putative leucine-rich repeat receptor-like protein kinase [Quercus suber]|uniref:Leucine-rich repeat receptor-like protein kinase n=1 Tax=Quercus suber TaxID=58331 RepID=A0AAW0J551_QUESU